MTNGKFQPETHVQVIVLQSAEGKPCASIYKDANGKPKTEYLFTLTDGRKWYASEYVAGKLRDIGAQIPIQVVKLEYGRIEIAPVAASPAESPALAPPVETPAERTAADVAMNKAQPGNTNTAHMMACFLVALDSIGEAQTYAKRKGIGITFTSDNVTSAALSCYINECRNRGRL
jgi:hypothetical protein